MQFSPAGDVYNAILAALAELPSKGGGEILGMLPQASRTLGSALKKVLYTFDDGHRSEYLS